MVTMAPNSDTSAMKLGSNRTASTRVWRDPEQIRSLAHLMVSASKVGSLLSTYGV
jgi:hypothetical protein